MKMCQLLYLSQRFAIGWMIIAAMLYGHRAVSQTAKVSKDEMKKLSGWVGEWKGEGWQMDQQTWQEQPFTVEEKVESRLDGLALIVEGKGMRGTNLGHHALAMIYYNADKGHYDFNSIVTLGQSALAKGEFNDKGEFIWGFEIPQGQIRYIIKIEGDTWTESGAFSMDGNTWYPTMEMKLTRVK